MLNHSTELRLASSDNVKAKVVTIFSWSFHLQQSDVDHSQHNHRWAIVMSTTVLWWLQGDQILKLLFVWEISSTKKWISFPSQNRLGEILIARFLACVGPQMWNPKIINSFFSPFPCLQETECQVMRHWHSTSSDQCIFILDVREGNRGELVKSLRPYP